MNDAKIKKLTMRHGAEGYAVYFHCLELIVGDINANNITFQLEHDAEIIADTLRIKGEGMLSPVEKVSTIMRFIVELGLFEENDGYITCLKIARSLTQSMTSNPKMRQLISSIKQEHHDGIMTPSCKKRIEQKDKKERIDNTSIPSSELHLDVEEWPVQTCYSFEQFYNDYKKKVERKKAEAKYKKINESDRELIKSHVKLYVSSTPDKLYRKSPLVYLNGECWNDEIIANDSRQNKGKNSFEVNTEDKSNFW